jgi:hypothetical protein
MEDNILPFHLYPFIAWEVFVENSRAIQHGLKYVHEFLERGVLKTTLMVLLEGE